MSMAEKYMFLIARFVAGEITAPQFEMLYLDMFKNESEILPDKAYGILNELFLDVDAYCSVPNLRDETDLDDKQLLEKAIQALARLEA